MPGVDLQMSKTRLRDGAEHYCVSMELLKMYNKIAVSRSFKCKLLVGMMAVFQNEFKTQKFQLNFFESDHRNLGG
jgi:hypothetical protein